MTKLLISALALASSVLFTSLTADPALADRRVALVIGNAQYKNTSLSLPNPKNDADDVAATLRTLGFEVVLATNADKRALDQAMQQFARQVTRSEEHTSELQSQSNLVCRLLLEKKNPAAPLPDHRRLLDPYHLALVAIALASGALAMVNLGRPPLCRDLRFLDSQLYLPVCESVR